MADLFNKLVNWVNLEPAVSLLMIVTAVVLFGSAFRGYNETNGAFWPWLRRVIEASVGALLFIGLLWGFRAVLNDNIATYYSTHGSLSDVSRASAWSIWGRPHTQIELTISHSIEVEVKEEIPREDPTQPPAYRMVKQRQDVPQNSITGFKGDVKMSLNEREKGYALYSGYVVDVRLDYDVVNDSDTATDAEFHFPLSQGQTLFENFVIKMDDRDVSSDLRFAQDLVSWVTRMKPHQRSKVLITYSSRGMDYFYYQIPIQREIKNFNLTLTVDRLPVSLLNYPDGVITPTEVQPTADGRGSILTWNLDRAITVAGMGVALIQPQQPGAQVLRVLVISPYALTLLGAMLALTMLIWGMNVRFLDLALLSAVYCMQFLLMAAISDFVFGFWGSLIIGAALTLFLSWLLFRRLPSRLLRALIYVLVAFFSLVYPLTGLVTELSQQNAFGALMQVGLILFITGLALYVRSNPSENSTASVGVGNPLLDLLTGWISREPVAGLLMVVTAALISARALTYRPQGGSSFQVWVLRLVHALAGGLVFLGMAGLFQFLLVRDYTSFSSLYGSFTVGGSLPNKEWARWRSIYGGPLTQTDLILMPTIQQESVEAIPPVDPAGSTLYRNITVDQPVSENLITAFEGQLKMELVNPTHPMDGFNAFTLYADYRYQIENPLQTATKVKFLFVLPDARLAREVSLLMDGKKIPILLEDKALAWEASLQPGQRSEVSIHYLVSGMDYFVFEIPAARQITDFSLNLALNSDASGLITEPEGAVGVEVADQGLGKLVTWKVANAIAAPRMGIYMTQGWPYAPSHELIVVLPYAARALLFFLAMMAFTLLIAGVPIDLRQFALLAALFCVPFLILMAGGLPLPASVTGADRAPYQVWFLPLLTLLPLSISYKILRGVPPLPRVLILCLMVLFLCAFPFTGLIPDEQKRNAILGAVQVGMIFYIFAFSLFVRVRLALRS